MNLARFPRVRLAHLPTGVNYVNHADTNQMSVIKEIEKQMIEEENKEQARMADVGYMGSAVHRQAVQQEWPADVHAANRTQAARYGQNAYLGAFDGLIKPLG